MLSRAAGFGEVSQLWVCARDYNDDYADGVGESSPEEVGEFSVGHLANAPVEWLTRLAAPHSIEALIKDIEQQLQERDTRYSSAVASVTAKTREAYSRLASEIETKADQLGYHAVLEHWRKAQVGVDLDPATALAHGSTLFEAVLLAVIKHWGLSAQQDTSATALYNGVRKTAAAHVDLVLQEDVRTLLGGIGSVIAGVTGLRNKASIAHAGQGKATPLLARLAVNSAGIVSMFLIELADLGPPAKSGRNEGD